MVLVRQWSTEEGHDAVAHHLVHRTFVAMHCLHRALEHGVEDLSRFFRIPVGQQLHGSLEIGEEHGDLLALAFKSGPGREDLLGEVPRGVGLDRGTRLALRRSRGARIPGRTSQSLKGRARSWRKSASEAPRTPRRTWRPFRSHAGT